MTKKKKLENLSVYKKDSTGLFSGNFKTQIFQDKKDKLEKEAKKEEQKKYKDTTSES